MQTNLTHIRGELVTEKEIDRMLMRDAIGWFDCWRECPPMSEALALIAMGLGVWKPPETKQRKPSSEQELLAFAMFARATMGK